MTGAGKEVEQLECSLAAAEMHNGEATVESTRAAPQHAKLTHPYLEKQVLCISKKMENINLHKYLHMDNL